MSIAVIFFLLTLLGVDGVYRLSVAAPTDATDAAAMQAIAKSTGADRSLGWGVKSADPCDGTWSGVHCDKDLGHVTAISASRAGLVGTLSGTDLVDLSFLSELDLSFNRLGGDLPILPRPLNLLTTLNLRSNSFLNMADDFFRSFPALETVVLDDNMVILGDIAEVPPCHGLRSFSANNVTIWGKLPVYFGNTTLFPALESLSLAMNQLEGAIPPYFGKNSNIKFLDISRQVDGGYTDKFTGRLDFVWTRGDPCGWQLMHSTGYCQTSPGLPISRYPDSDQQHDALPILAAVWAALAVPRNGNDARVQSDLDGAYPKHIHERIESTRKRCSLACLMRSFGPYA
ncbi:hypothetical protein ACQ4PT_072187 [Festuca glaucescens]